MPPPTEDGTRRVNIWMESLVRSLNDLFVESPARGVCDSSPWAKGLAIYIPKVSCDSTGQSLQVRHRFVESIFMYNNAYPMRFRQEAVNFQLETGANYW